MEEKILKGRGIPILHGEYWWGGRAHCGVDMPWNADSRVDLDLSEPSVCGDQSSPLFVSSLGRYIWSKKPFGISFANGVIRCDGRDEVILSFGHSHLRGAYLAAMKKHFPFTGKLPNEMFFSAAQYNTWIELLTNQRQNDILKYAGGIIAAGMSPGILIIDGGWQTDYGVFEFQPGKFDDPKEMVDQLHRMGFKVMLWVSPIVASAGVRFKELKGKALLVKDRDGKIAVREWWSGFSALLDLTNPEAVSWFREQLENLMTVYGIDGFKFDAGDLYFYRDDDQIFRPMLANEHTAEFCKFGLQYEFNEYRSAWKFAGQALVARLQDKAHSWGENGLAMLIPNTLAQGLLGYAYCCPDMVGGGEEGSFNGEHTLDQELFVRWAQASALLPMMQFSAAPWRVLSEENFQIVMKTAERRRQYSEIILKLAENAAVTGEPIVRHMAYQFPGCGYEKVSAQFMLGGEILVAPVLEKGAVKKIIYFPPGKWLGDDGSLVDGRRRAQVEVPLERLPVYRRVE